MELTTSTDTPLNRAPSSRVFRSSLLLAGFFGLDKVLALIRQVVIARQFGLSPELDAFNAANNLPDLLFALISGGAMAVAIIPVLTEYLETRGRSAAWDVFSRLANLAFLVTAGLSVLIAIFAQPLVGWELGIAPGFGASQQVLVADLMRLNLIATLLFSISGLIMASLQANQHFLLPAIAPSLYNLGQIFGAAVLAPETPYQFGPLALPAWGLGVHGLVYGVILGAVFHISVQIPGLIRYRFRWTPRIQLKHPGVRQILHLLGPRLLTMFFIQLIFMARDNIASRLTSGAVTALTYGWWIMQVPETMIGTAIGVALLPTLGEHVARGEWDSFRERLNRAVRSVFALTLPVAALLIVTIRPLLVVLGFDAAGTEMVVWTTRAYLVGLAGHSLLELAARGFYAQQDARTPLFASALNTGGYIAFAVLFYRRLGAAGVGLANTLAFTGEALLLLYLLNRRHPGVLQVTDTLLRVGLGVGLGSLVAYLVLLSLPAFPLMAAVLALFVGAGVVVPFVWPELRQFVKL
ncbi:MAG: murein biosynthesis integral membrane protein MurJ [Chloroflexota bacterium]